MKAPPTRSKETIMDHYGIGQAMEGMALTYFQSARRSGRTTLLVENLKDGDRVWFLDSREADRVKRMCADRGIEVDTKVADPAEMERFFERGRSKGRTIFDHSWVEKFYLDAIHQAQRSLDDLERQASGSGATHREERWAATKIEWPR